MARSRSGTGRQFSQRRLARLHPPGPIPTRGKRGDDESACRRGSVRRPGAAGWPSIYAAYLGIVSPKRHRAGRPIPCSALLRVGFTEPPGLPRALVRSCRTVSPLPVTLCELNIGPIGGLLSVALSCGSPRLAVSQHPALWSPDLPQPRTRQNRALDRDHPADSSSRPLWHAPGSRTSLSGPVVEPTGQAAVGLGGGPTR
jgi:hypothetical protein